MTARVDLRRDTDHAKAHGKGQRLRSSAILFSLVMYAYLCSLFIKPGVITWALTIFPLVVIIVTAWSRVNDLSVDMSSHSWQVRRAGLAFTAWFALGQLLLPPSGLAPWPSWLVVFGVWGFALVWMTTPHQPPWAHYVWRNHPAASPHPLRRRSDDLDSNP